MLTSIISTLRILFLVLVMNSGFNLAHAIIAGGVPKDPDQAKAFDLLRGNLLKNGDFEHGLEFFANHLQQGATAQIVRAVSITFRPHTVARSRRDAYRRASEVFWQRLSLGWIAVDWSVCAELPVRDSGTAFVILLRVSCQAP